jgi:hypothetical protein
LDIRKPKAFFWFITLIVRKKQNLVGRMDSSIERF